jgi:hypothetical protein
MDRGHDMKGLVKREVPAPFQRVDNRLDGGGIFGAE